MISPSQSDEADETVEDGTFKPCKYNNNKYHSDGEYESDSEDLHSEGDEDEDYPLLRFQFTVGDRVTVRHGELKGLSGSIVIGVGIKEKKYLISLDQKDVKVKTMVIPEAFLQPEETKKINNSHKAIKSPDRPSSWVETKIQDKEQRPASEELETTTIELPTRHHGVTKPKGQNNNTTRNSRNEDNKSLHRSRLGINDMMPWDARELSRNQIKRRAHASINW